MSAARDLIPELHAFLGARLREVIASDTATPREKRSARDSLQWNARAVSEALGGTARSAVYDMLIRDAKKWRKHPDFQDDWLP